jgi:predicted RNA-binding Zn ribbon-like protein
MTTSVVGTPDIERLLAIVNTRHEREGRVRSPHDHLADPALASTYFRRALGTVPNRALSARDLRRMRAVRAVVWRLVYARDRAGFDAGAQRLLAATSFRVSPDGSVIPRDTGWSGWVTGALPALSALPELRRRLRPCAGRCGWILVDRSRNQSRRWCRTCSNRENVRAHRRRERARRAHEPGG